MCVFVCVVCVCLCVPVYVKTCFKFVSCSAERKRGSATALRATSHWNSHHTPACFQLAAGGAVGRNIGKVAGLLVVCVCVCIGEQWAGGGWWKRKGASWRQRKWDDPVPQYALKKRVKKSCSPLQQWWLLCFVPQKEQQKQRQNFTKLEDCLLCASTRSISCASLLIISFPLMIFLWCFCKVCEVITAEKLLKYISLSFFTVFFTWPLFSSLSPSALLVITS